MAAFTKVRQENLRDLVHFAEMRGLEHQIVDEDAGWATFQFTTHYSKLSFDEMAKQNGIAVQESNPQSTITDALEAISEGSNPDVVLSLLIESTSL